MVRSAPLVAVLALTGSLLITGCQSTSYSCRGGECHVTVNGAPNDLEINDRTITVSEVSGSDATFSIDGSPAQTIPVGGTARVGAAEITVTSIKDQEVKFDLR